MASSGLSLDIRKGEELEPFCYQTHCPKIIFTTAEYAYYMYGVLFPENRATSKLLKLHREVELKLYYLTTPYPINIALKYSKLILLSNNRNDVI